MRFFPPVMLGVFAAPIWAALRRAPAGTLRGQLNAPIIAAFSILPVILIWFFIDLLAWRLTLSGNGIEMRRLLPVGARRLRMAEIAGWRWAWSGKDSCLEFVPRDPPQRRIRVMNYFTRDAAFWEWVGQFPHLDGEGRVQPQSASEASYSEFRSRRWSR